MKIIFFSLICAGYIFSQTPDDQNTFRLAQAFEQSGEFERAVQLYEMLIRKDSLNYPYFDGLRRIYIQLKRYDDAITLSSNRLKKTPADFALQANIGSLFSMEGRGTQADSVWDIVLFSSGNNQLACRTVANEQVNQRLFDKGITTYLRGRKISGDPNLFANELAYLYSFMMDYENATREYVRMLRQNDLQFDFIKSRLVPIVAKNDGLIAAIKIIAEELHLHESIPLLRIQMWLSMEDNRYGDAFTVAKKIEQLINSSGAEMFQFAEQAFHEKAYTIAAQAYQLSVQQSAQIQFTVAAKFGYARCIEELSALGDTAFSSTIAASQSMLETRPSFSGAISLYEKIASDFPFSNLGANSLYRIGWIRYKQLFDLDGALAIFDSVSKITPAGPMIPSVLSTIGDINISRGKLEEAQKKFLAVNASPYANQDQKNTAQLRLAEIRFFNNNFDSTLLLLQPLTENLRADESNDALMLQYFITENKFQFVDALKLYAHAEFLARQFKTAEAIRQFSEIVDLYPVAPLADDALLRKAEYSIQLHRYDDALSAYQKLLENYKGSIERDKTQFKIGEVYQFFLNNKEKAIKAYEVILEQFPFSLFTEEARKKIRQLRGDSI